MSKIGKTVYPYGVVELLAQGRHGSVVCWEETFENACRHAQELAQANDRVYEVVETKGRYVLKNVAVWEAREDD